MKKILLVVPLTVIFIVLFGFINVNAAAIDNYQTVVIIKEDTSDSRPWRIVAYNSDVIITNFDSYTGVAKVTGTFAGFSQSTSSFMSLSDAVAYVPNIEYFYASGNVSYFVIDTAAPVYVVKGTVINQSTEDPEIIDPNVPTPTPDPTWYQKMWDDLGEKLGNPSFWFGDWFLNIIDSVFGDDENDPTGPPKPPLSTHVTIGNPTLAPSPIPIPYSTVVIPKTDIVTGETVYETNYYYNISGTPIITSSPPINTPASGNGGNGIDYTPIGGDPYSIPKVSWLSNVEIGGEDYDGIDSVTDGLGSIDEIGSEYTDGMSVVEDATGTLPTSWILLIGVAAAIPLVAGLISRFLS